MLALHARRSHASIKAFPREKPLVVALTGTDVYRDIHQSAEARESLELAASPDRAAAQGRRGAAARGCARKSASWCRAPPPRCGTGR